MNITNWKTVVGVPYSQAIAELRKQLPVSAYKPLPGSSGLTDISPAWALQIFTDVFGPAGFGWWYEYETVTTHEWVQKTRSGERNMVKAIINDFRLFYQLVNEEGHLVTSKAIVANGCADNEDFGFAVRGAITNALNAAFAKLTWQVGVYKGDLDRRHTDTAARAEASGKGFSPRPTPQNTQTQPTPTPQPTDLDALLGVPDAPAPQNTPPPPAPQPTPSVDELEVLAATVFPFGDKKGLPFSSIDRKGLGWLSHSYVPRDERGVKLQAAAKRYLELTKAG